MKTKSSAVKTRASETVTGLSSPTVVRSKRPAGRSSPPPGVGGASTPSSLTPSQRQMTLGTMLGDAHMRPPKTLRGNPSYASRHGWKRHKYNCRKYDLLREFTGRKPSRQKNSGYGKWLSVFVTWNCPAFWPIASLCLHGGRKRVTRARLSSLTWEGIAWWYMDDGSLQGRGAVFNTQGFTKAEVELLAAYLTENGVAAKVAQQCSRHDPSRCYWVVKLTVEATYQLVDRIRPYVFPEMAYKIDLPPRNETVVCYWCGNDFRPPVNSGWVYAAGEAERPCCRRPACRRARHRKAGAAYMEKPGAREAKNAKSRDRYAANLERERERCRRKARALRAADPERVRTVKARYLAKKIAERQARPWTCRECGLTEPLGSRDPKTRYCVACRMEVDRRLKQDSAYRKRNSLA